jgi:uracil-DNA glycosylase
MDNIHKSWDLLFEKYTFDLDLLYNTNNECNIFPIREQILRVFEMDLNNIQVVLLGQDPYHGKEQAHGLSFSVPIGQKIPPSLRNIHKELNNCFPERNYEFKHGSLERWFNEEGIFLLNSSLTVEERNPGSHIKIWEGFTNNVIKFISENNKKCVFLLLGNFAKSKGEYICDKNRIISAPHPSPLARGFVGSSVFLKIEELLDRSINWSL